VLGPAQLCRLRNAVAAAWALQAKLEAVDPSAGGHLDSGLLGMRVVREGRSTLQATAARFVTRAATQVRSSHKCH
jgi:hypothetical protein